MEKIALCVDVRARPGQRAALVERLSRHAAVSLENEPGCLQFQILAAKDDPDQIIIFEVYENEAALAAHDASPHMQSWREDGAPMIASRTRITALLVEAGSTPPQKS